MLLQSMQLDSLKTITFCLQTLSILGSWLNFLFLFYNDIHKKKINKKMRVKVGFGFMYLQFWNDWSELNPDK